MASGGCLRPVCASIRYNNKAGMISHMEGGLQLTVLQTSDAFHYSRMLRATSQTVIEYCRRRGFAYESFIGIKRGSRGAHAAFNRILMLDELIERGHRGWALHMDADAYVYDLDFDLTAYLADKQDRSAIMATIPGETVPWHINSGVLFFNLGHADGRALVTEWKRRFLEISDEQLRDVSSVWDHLNDQTMLYRALADNEALRLPVLFEDAMLFNHVHGRFIRQLLNSLETDLTSRTEKLESAVREVLGDAPRSAVGADETRLVAEFYRIILGRGPDPGSQGYTDLLIHRGIARAAPDVVRALLDSEEYRRRITSL